VEIETGSLKKMKGKPKKAIAPYLRMTENINIDRVTELITPERLKQKIPLVPKLADKVFYSRKLVNDIVLKMDSRLMIITGPCSIHSEEVAIDYANRLKKLSFKVKEQILLVMRVYFEKPRTTTGWKGLINDPHLNGSFDITSSSFSSK